MAVGSLKENSRLFQYDELDATLLLGGDIKQYLFFNTRNQNVEISSALPSSHPLQKYNHHNVFNVDKFFKQYLTSMYHVCATMAARWPEELSQVKLETFTVDYQPCLQCINTDYQDAVYSVRCHHELGCHDH